MAKDPRFVYYYYWDEDLQECVLYDMHPYRGNATHSSFSGEGYGAVLKRNSNMAKKPEMMHSTSLPLERYNHL